MQNCIDEFIFNESDGRLSSFDMIGRYIGRDIGARYVLNMKFKDLKRIYCQYIPLCFKRLRNKSATIRKILTPEQLLICETVNLGKISTLFSKHCYILKPSSPEPLDEYITLECNPFIDIETISEELRSIIDSEDTAFSGIPGDTDIIAEYSGYYRFQNIVDLFTNDLIGGTVFRCDYSYFTNKYGQINLLSQWYRDNHYRDLLLKHFRIF